ncbi:MAG: hypothetical protein F6K26_03665 [Moorea sp. SIO2I5]|nr:hypothetical protein [Moorena sp. SIO2I5]
MIDKDHKKAGETTANNEKNTEKNTIIETAAKAASLAMGGASVGAIVGAAVSTLPVSTVTGAAIGALAAYSTLRNRRRAKSKKNLDNQENEPDNLQN